MVPLGLVKIKMEMQSWRLCPRTWRAFQSCVLNESGKHSGLGSRFPETIRSPCHWLPVTFGSSLAFSVGEVVQGGQEMVVFTCFFPALGLNRNTMRMVFRSLFLTYGALGVWFLSPVSLGLAKKQVWLVIEKGSWAPRTWCCCFGSRNEGEGRTQHVQQSFRRWHFRCVFLYSPGV